MDSLALVMLIAAASTAFLALLMLELNVLKG